MRILEDIENVPAGMAASVVTVGKFFAVHLGHDALIRMTRERAVARRAASVVLTFDRHPREILEPGTAFPLLTTLEERLQRIAAIGVDYVAFVRLDRAFMAQLPEEFVRALLLNRLRMVEIVASDNFRFGRGATGSVETLHSLSAASGFDVTIIPPVLVEGEPVSSSRVARCLEAGRVEQAAQLLGRAYGVSGPVVAGEQLGRRLGFPTLNLAVDPRRVLPKDAVYAGTASWADQRRPAAISVGTRPTVDGTLRVTEAHLLDFSGDLYGETVTLEFRRFLRDQERFESIEVLQDQIARDVEEVKRKP